MSNIDQTSLLLGQIKAQNVEMFKRLDELEMKMEGLVEIKHKGSAWLAAMTLMAGIIGSAITHFWPFMGAK